MLRTGLTYFKSWFSGTAPVALPLTLRRKRVYILPTRNGVLFMIILFGMLLGSVNHNNNLGFLLTFLLSGMAFNSMFYTYRNLLGVRVLSVATAPVFAGEDAVFEFLVRVDGASRAAVAFGFAEETITIVNLDENSDNRVRVVKSTEIRGKIDPGSLVIATMYPFGFFRAWSPLELNLESLVYPRPVAAPLITTDDGAMDNGEKTVQKPGVDDFMGLKPYQPGDSLQQVAWKAYSRGQGLLTKAFAVQAGSSVMLDWKGFKEPEVERKISMLCDMVLKAHRRQMIYGLRLPGVVVEPDRSESHKRNCLKALALFASPDKR
jgi:uncharacterized protein (DUF58 family)